MVSWCASFFPCLKKEQKRRFLERIDDGQKNWKFSSNDATERDFWDDYMKAYEEMIQQTDDKEGAVVCGAGG